MPKIGNGMWNSIDWVKTFGIDFVVIQRNKTI